MTYNGPLQCREHGVPQQMSGRHFPVSGIVAQCYHPVGHVLLRGHLVQSLHTVPGRVVVRVTHVVNEPDGRVNASQLDRALSGVGC